MIVRTIVAVVLLSHTLSAQVPEWINDAAGLRQRHSTRLEKRSCAFVDTELQRIETLPFVRASYELFTSEINPPDNGHAINTTGTMVCVINSRILVVDKLGTLLSNTQLRTLFRSPINGVLASQFLCDPRVVYDGTSQRFFVSAMTCEGNSATSQLLIAVSETDDPMGSWVTFQLPCDFSPPLPVRTWFDFPQLLVSGDRVYISFNLFENSGGYRQSGVLVLPKEDLINGTSISLKDADVFLDFPSDPYALFPIAYSDTIDTSSAVMISNGRGSSASSTLELYTFRSGSDGKLNTVRSTVNVPEFEPPGFTSQRGSNVLLSCFDQRGASAVTIGDRLHYVFTIGLPDGRSAIRYLVLRRANAAWSVLRSRTIERPGLSLAYPSIATFPSERDGLQTVVSYVFAGRTEFPGVAARVIDSTLAAGDEVIVNEGVGPVEFQSFDNYGRWADYITSVIDVSENTPTLWVFAPIGGSSSRWVNTLSNLAVSNSTSVASESRSEATPRTSTLATQCSSLDCTVRYWSPSTTQIEVALYTLSGIDPSTSYMTTAVEGWNTLTLDLTHVPYGVYGLVVRSAMGMVTTSLIMR